MHRIMIASVSLVLLAGFDGGVFANEELLKTHCGKCHSGAMPKGEFGLSSLGATPNKKNADLWVTSLDYVKAGEMPPAKQSKLSRTDRKKIVEFLTERIRQFNRQSKSTKRLAPRRLNNRELKNSVCDILGIEDVGTHQPTANLLGDTLFEGFDTNGDSLGFSEFHLEQYIEAFRKIVDATILEGEQPPKRLHRVTANMLRMTSRAQRPRRERANRKRDSIDFLDPRNRVYFSNFERVPASGRYKIKIRAMGKDRGVYNSKETGIFAGDRIKLRVHLGDRVRDFELQDEKATTIELDEWIAAGTRIELSYPTDGLRLRGNGNFKFQYAIAHDYIKRNDPQLYEDVLAKELPRAPARTRKRPQHWSHWTGQWQGPRPRLFGAEIEGPIYESWPPKRQTALIGERPDIRKVEEILRPIAEKAWRRKVRDGELDRIVTLVEKRAEALGTIGALKEGIVAVLVSPSFLLINPENSDPGNRFATKLSYLLRSTTPSEDLLTKARNDKLNSFDAIRAEVQYQLDHAQADAFVREFPFAWLQLDRINFMAPDPDRFPMYDRKRLGDDMVAEVRHFFAHAVKNNIPVPELLTANYSFVNADLARVYGIDDVPSDSKLRKYTFKDGRRGGLLGMGAFLTLTADSLGTSPIHRAVYVMENFLGIKPSPPPADVNISEPDVRQAKTIKQVLAAHKSNATCASCHKTIDPYGYAFENFDPVGAWRDAYTGQIAKRPTRKRLQEIRKLDQERAAKGLPPLPKPWENKPIAVDATGAFRNGVAYKNIVDYRRELQSEANRDRFVRCFIKKLLTYANGKEPEDFTEVERILAKSAEHEYRIVETIAAVVDSPLFREH